MSALQATASLLSPWWPRRTYLIVVLAICVDWASSVGRNIPDPMKEVGEHIKGRRKSVGDDLPQGKLNNATWIAPNMYGRTIQDPMGEVGEHIDGRREKIHADIKSGDLRSATSQLDVPRAAPTPTLPPIFAHTCAAVMCSRLRGDPPCPHDGQ